MGGGTGAQNQGLDMSKVGVINPRTTDFGIGPTRFAGFEDYGTSGGDYTPNAELLKNLNAPGYNPVNEGDYGYDEVPIKNSNTGQAMPIQEAVSTNKTPTLVGGLKAALPYSPNTPHVEPLPVNVPVNGYDAYPPEKVNIPMTLPYTGEVAPNYVDPRIKDNITYGGLMGEVMPKNPDSVIPKRYPYGYNEDDDNYNGGNPPGMSSNDFMSLEPQIAKMPTQTPKMSSGGLSSMATPVASYYTFGQPADILANLGMRPPPPMNPIEEAPQIGQQQPPQQAQQQGLPQQMPTQMPQQTPQGMPQQGTMPQQQGMPPPMRKGGLPHISNVPMTQGRMDFRQGSAVHGEGDGQSDDIPAMLADGEYVIDSETVAQIGNGSTKAGAQALDKFREGIRAHKRSAPINKIPPKTKALTSYLKGAR
jgi:hypothetical protein